MKLGYEVSRAIASLGSNIRLLLTLSGGADSVALLIAFHHLNVDVVAAHCNFHLRGAESDRDEAFVRSLCSRLGVELHLKHFDVAAYRQQHGGSMEMACRELRYDWFYRLAKDLGCTRIVTAHHADDNVETMLLNMLRGCGLEGAKGMIMDNGVIFRPLLMVHRKDIEDYLLARNEKWIVDSSNLSDEPDRNFIRNNVLPLLDTRFKNAKQRLADTQRHLSESFLIYNQWRQKEVYTHILSIEELRSSPSPSTLMHEWLHEYGYSKSQTSEMLRESERIAGKSRFWYAKDTFVWLDSSHFRRMPLKMNEMDISETILDVTPELLNKIQSNANRNIAYFPHPLSFYKLRNLKPGDRINISPGRSKKVSTIMKESDIPRPYRTQYNLLSDSATDEVLWIPGVRRCNSHLVDSRCDVCYKFETNI